MVSQKLNLRIITPQEIKLDENVDMVIMRATTGDLGVLPGHQPFSVLLDYGIFRLLDDDGERRLAVFGGIANINGNVLTVLTEIAEWPEDANRVIAEIERKNAELKMQGRADDVDLQNDQVSLRRELVRIEVSSYPLLRQTDEKKPSQGDDGEPFK